MKIKPIGSNQTVLTNGHGAILFSYETPVAMKANGKAWKTEKKWSPTTSRHINKFLEGMDADTLSQSTFDKMGMGE